MAGWADYFRDEETQGQRRTVTPEAHTACYFTQLSLHSPRGPLDRGPVWTCPLPPGITSLGAAEQGLGFLRAGDMVSPATNYSGPGILGGRGITSCAGGVPEESTARKPVSVRRLEVTRLGARRRLEGWRQKKAFETPLEVGQNRQQVGHEAVGQGVLRASRGWLAGRWGHLWSEGPLEEETF